MVGVRIPLAAWLAAATIMAAMTGPASAGLSFCNDTEDRQMVAIGYSANGVWTSEGWWPVEAGNCREIVSGDLEHRFFYWRATTLDGVVKDGQFDFCVAPDKPFTIADATDCEARGHVTAGFRQTDTGLDSRDFTIRIDGVGPGELATGGAPNDGPVEGRTPGHGSEPATEPAQADAAPTGDPVAETGIFVECSGRVANCRLDVADWSIFVPDDGRTPSDVMAVLKAARPGDAVAIEGEAIERFDISVIARLTGAAILPPLPFDNALLRIRGGWHAADNSATFFFFGKDGVFIDVDFNPSEPVSFDVVAVCDRHADAPPYLMINGKGPPRCYELRLPAEGRIDLTEPGSGKPPMVLMRAGLLP